MVEVTNQFDFNPFPATVEICEGEIYIFDAGGGFVSYLWNDDGNFITQPSPLMSQAHLLGAGG
jgi:hypothetical protein